MQNNVKKHATSAPLSLADALEFSPDELEANRAGQFSPMQVYRLRTRRRRSVALGIGMVLIAALAATIFLFLGMGEGSSPILAIVGVGITMMNAALCGILARFWMRLNRDIQRQHVHVIQGKVERVLKPVNRRILNYMIRIGEVEVFISQQAWEAFEHNAEYIIYRASYTGTLFTAERVH